MYQNLDVNNENDLEQIYKLGVALASPVRVAILSQLKSSETSVIELARKNMVSVSSIMFHLNLLKEAKLINIVTTKTSKGNKRIVNRSCFNANLSMFVDNPIVFNNKKYYESMPVGCFTDAEFGDKSGFLGENAVIALYGDGPFVPERFNARLVYLNYGYVEYSFNNGKFRNKEPLEISFTLEICSEAPYYNNNFKSDITFYINNKKILTYTSPGDFGGRKGKFAPDFQSLNSSQFGLLKNIIVNKNGVYLENTKIDSNITIDDLKINESNCIKLKIESNLNDENPGGFNIFGKGSGDFQQDIEMNVIYVDK